MLSAVWSPFEAGFFVRFQCWANPDMSLPPPIHARCRISINSTTDTLSKTFTQSTMLYSNQTHTQFLTCLWKVNLAKKTSLFSRSGRRRNRDVKKCDFFSIPTKTKSRCWKCDFSEFQAWVAAGLAVWHGDGEINPGSHLSDSNSCRLIFAKTLHNHLIQRGYFVLLMCVVIFSGLLQNRSFWIPSN